MSGPSPFDAVVERILEQQAPLNVRAAAARGALPLPRPTLIRLFVFLLKDDDESTRAAAKESLDNLSEDAIHEALDDAACQPQVLSYFAASAAKREKLAERIAFHPSVPANALAVLATTGNNAVIDLVLTNQEKLLSQPVLLERLMVNPHLRADQRGRILELLNRVAKAGQKSGEESEGGDETDEEVSAENLEEAALLLDVEVGDLLSASEIMDGDEFAESDDVEIRSAYQKIVTLNAAQKAIMAMKGGREERMILIRDTNKVVALAVLRNGRITDLEIEGIARMRNVSDEVLRQLGTNRDWVKNYAVIRSLVYNPRTPQGIAANFIPRLVNRDLKELARSRDVPELIRRNAKRIFDTRTQAQTNMFKKK